MKDDLEKIRAAGRYREISYLESAQAREAKIEGRSYRIFSSNDYLGLCNNRRLKQVAVEAIERFGVGTGASRLTAGSNSLHRELEKSLAHFKKRESALVYSSGYMANIGVISSLANRDSVVFCDRLNHASIIDGIRLSGARLVPYRHKDMDDLEAKLRRYARRKNLIVTDGVFSMDGDVADLQGIIHMARKYHALTIVDDAHGTGVIGSEGRGSEEYLGMEGHIDICIGTMSKAMGAEGGFVTGSQEIIDYLRQTSRSFIYSTSPSPASMAVSMESLEIIGEYGYKRLELSQKGKYLREKVKEIGLDVLDGETPIIPIVLGGEQAAIEYSSKLMDHGIYLSCIRPPTVPKGSSRLRVTLTADHSYEDLDLLLECLSRIGKELGVI